MVKRLSFCLFLFVFAPFSLMSQSTQNLNPTDETKQYLDKIYTNISGFGINNEEYKTITSQGGAPTYGEITYDSAQKLIDNLKLSKKDVFYDLGCGVGKFVTQVFLNSPVKKSAGVELAHTRVTKAQQIKDQLKKDKMIRKRRKIDFLEENITTADLKDATVVFMCSTCFSKDLMEIMTNKFAKGKKGLRILTLKDLPKNKNFKLLKKYTLPMTWSSGSTVYLYKRV